MTPPPHPEAVSLPGNQISNTLNRRIIRNISLTKSNF